MTIPPAASDCLADLGPLYHRFSLFGVDNAQLPGIFGQNQQAKAPIITAYIALAIAKARVVGAPLSFTELFCADAYYAMVASRLGCDWCSGVDNDRDGFFGSAARIAERLGIRNLSLQDIDIRPDTPYEQVDIVANVGGLYHVDDPEGILGLSYGMARRYLIVQNVVSTATDDPDYFERPAPGWTWGNRFSRASFDRLVRRVCPRVIDAHFNILEGNERAEDRGSAYYLIEKPQ
jgi:hypothetical protein